MSLNVIKYCLFVQDMQMQKQQQQQANEHWMAVTTTTSEDKKNTANLNEKIKKKNAEISCKRKFN